MADLRRSSARTGSDATNPLDAYIARAVNQAPELAPTQRQQLAAILKPFAMENNSAEVDAA